MSPKPYIYCGLTGLRPKVVVEVYESGDLALKLT